MGKCLLIGLADARRSAGATHELSQIRTEASSIGYYALTALFHEVTGALVLNEKHKLSCSNSSFNQLAESGCSWSDLSVVSERPHLENGECCNDSGR